MSIVCQTLYWVWGHKNECGIIPDLKGLTVWEIPLISMFRASAMCDGCTKPYECRAVEVLEQPRSLKKASVRSWCLSKS